jgi:maltooligosyltrehalose synthase
LVWGATRLVLGDPGRGGNPIFTNLFTGERLELEPSDDRGPPCLPLARVFADFPVALLYQEAP